jgi:ComF family protein
LRRATSRIADALRRALPQHCELCTAPTPGGLVCDACAADLPRIADPCPTCGLPGVSGAICGECIADPPPFDATLAALVYAFPVDRLIQRIKYGGSLALARWAGDTLAAAVDGKPRMNDPCNRPQAIVALPLSAARQRERGFNQAGVIAARVAAVTGLPVVAPLERIAGGVPQAALPWAARRANVRGAFAATRAVEGASVAIVDDVMTTGATLAEAALALKRAGAARVTCWVVARTLRPDRD